MTKFIHELADFKDLISICASENGIINPALVEKDYWIMHTLWGLTQLRFSFHLKGGTSLSKGFGLIHRFSEDIDLKIEPNETLCGFQVYSGKNHNEKKHVNSRAQYYDWIAEYLKDKIPGIEEIFRDKNFDDISKLRSGGIKLIYKSHFSAKGIKSGILLEVGFDRTIPNQPKLISSWAYNRAIQNPQLELYDNRAKDVPCYEPKYTFVEKLQAVVRKFRLYKRDEQMTSFPANFIRHYYDLYQLLDYQQVQDFIGTTEYINFKKERFGGDDINISNSDAFKLNNANDRSLFMKEYERSANLYFKGRPTLIEILDRFNKFMDRL